MFFGVWVWWLTHCWAERRMFWSYDSGIIRIITIIVITIVLLLLLFVILSLLLLYVFWVILSQHDLSSLLTSICPWSTVWYATEQPPSASGAAMPDVPGLALSWSVAKRAFCCRYESKGAGSCGVLEAMEGRSTWNTESIVLIIYIKLAIDMIPLLTIIQSYMA